jgi:hypothetical protein
MPTSLDNVISNIQLNQDIGLATTINALKSDPSTLHTFLQQQQDKVYSHITKQKDDTFQKVYGDLQRSQAVENSTLRYYQRTKELSDLQRNIYNNQKEEANAVIENKNTFGRKNEMNEWSVGNKKDTLFVFSALFVVLSVLVFLTAFLRMNIISSSVWASICGLAVIVFILIVVNRAQYTDQVRNTRYWNKKKFGGNSGKIQVMCSNDSAAPAPTVGASHP